MRYQIPVKLNGVDPRLIQIESNVAGDQHLVLRHSNNFLRINSAYGYLLEKHDAIKLAQAILDYYGIKHE